jgi:RNA polymerase sigma-70 factor (ECF subfamily)
LVESDEDLVGRVRRGERDAFSVMVERYEQPALLVARGILQSWPDAADAVQDAFVTAYLQINRLWSPHKFGAWFLRIVRRQALWHRRRRAARQRLVVSVGAERAFEAPKQIVAAVDVVSMIARLPEQECVVVTMRHLKELSVIEIARVTGRPVGTVTKQLSRAYARMRPWLESEG